MKEKTVGVLGAGLMGAGIAEVAARAGHDVILVDFNADAAAKGRMRIEKGLRKSVEKETITQANADEALARVRIDSKLAELAGADLLIEAVFEDLDVKLEAFRQIDAVAGPDAIMASNTSSLSITKISAATKRPDRVLGLHFFYPVPRMKLVEIIRGLATSDATYERAHAFIEGAGKTAVLAQDYPGFIVNRLLLPMINEAVFCVMEGAKPADIDTAMKLGCNHPMGPLELADFVGIDVALATITGIYENLRDSKYRPCPLFVKMVEAGWLGRKSGRGFYEYS